MHAEDHPLDWLFEHARRRTAQGLRRTLVARSASERILDLAGNDYLGLASDPRVIEVGWSRCGPGARVPPGRGWSPARPRCTSSWRPSWPIPFCGYPAGLVFSSGYLANLGVVTALSGPGTLVVSDAANHASLVDACRLSRARIAVVAHNDVEAVDAALAGRAQRRALLVTDSVGSVDGDHAPLARLHEVCRARGALLVVDEAHALGVCGPGGARAARLGRAGRCRRRGDHRDAVQGGG